MHLLQLYHSNAYFFNSHPHKEDDGARTGMTVNLNLFNSHPHKEDDVFYGGGLRQVSFSTHILTRRMTSDKVHTSIDKAFQLTSSQGG